MSDPRRELVADVLNTLHLHMDREQQDVTLHPRKPRIKVRRGGRVYVITVKEKKP